ncbi:glycosyltransferase [Mycolicibacterium celeriflavum]|uniref:glycosyltransferase n=1 Tax=Mycolicibacterium celeriflavum TaxID=1249101 RepID=UPI0009F5B2B6|nr:glycosyltransferase [Mycolicibacterium celeriflavum]MCV7236499.1 glycosyltransferase [Mycolicibacterium celeriflavum]ORA47754.1 glycosyl transferase family 1 [Mycolicibacterium celeriflavum]
MSFVLASYGSRGDVEPCVAVGRELLRRGHQVRLAVAPDMVAFVESAGLEAVGYGPNARAWQDVHREFQARMSRPWKVGDLRRLWRENRSLLGRYLEESSATLRGLARDADLLLTGPLGEDVAANVAVFYGIPLAVMHFVPMRANGQVLQRSVTRFGEWAQWRVLYKKAEDKQRSELGLPKATAPAPRRIAGSLEIQAYDEVWFPGLAAEWGTRRPFVGTLTMQLPTDADEEIASWIAAGTPPIYFGFGSIPVELVESADDVLAMITDACAELGERALICSGWSDFGEMQSDSVKVVPAMNHAAVFPACRAVVHHGGSGTTAAGLRAGVPTLILSTWPEQARWGAQVKRLKVGAARPFAGISRDSLVEDLRTILAPEYLTRAREIAAQMTKAAESVANAADLLEHAALSEATNV